MRHLGWGGGGEETRATPSAVAASTVASSSKALENVSRKQVGTEGSYEVPESPAEKERTGTHTCDARPQSRGCTP